MNPYKSLVRWLALSLGVNMLRDPFEDRKTSAHESSYLVDLVDGERIIVKATHTVEGAYYMYFMKKDGFSFDFIKRSDVKKIMELDLVTC